MKQDVMTGHVSFSAKLNPEKWPESPWFVDAINDRNNDVAWRSSSKLQHVVQVHYPLPIVQNTQHTA